MYQNLKLSHTILRISLAIVFLWFGIDKFISPDYWVNAWMPQSIISFASSLGIGSNQLVYTNGVFEVVVGLSLLGNIFIETFSFLAVIFLVSISLFHGFNEVIVRDIGLAGGLLALVFWPSRKY